MPGSTSTESRGLGTARSTAKYQKKICSSSGTLRTTSTYQ